MHTDRTFARRALASLATVALATAGMAVYAAPATAAPQTITTPQLTLTLSDDTVSPGDTIDFTITHASIETSTPSIGFERDAAPLPSSIFSDASCTTVSCTFPGPFLSLTIAGVEGTVTTGTGTLTASPDLAPGSYTFTLRSRDIGGNPTPEPETFTLFVEEPAPVEADLAVELSAQAPLLSGRINYTTQVTNNGPGEPTATIVTQLPNQTTSVSGLSAGCTYNSGSKQVHCVTGTVLTSGTATSTFSAHLGLLSLGLPLSASATVSGSLTDPVAANNTDTANCNVVPG